MSRLANLKIKPENFSLTKEIIEIETVEITATGSLYSPNGWRVLDLITEISMKYPENWIQIDIITEDSSIQRHVIHAGVDEYFDPKLPTLKEAIKKITKRGESQR